MKKDEWSTTLNPSDSGMETTQPMVVPTLTVISHSDWSRVGDSLFLDGLAKGRSQKISRGKPDFAPPGRVIGKPLGDSFLSRGPFVLKSITNQAIVLEKRACRSIIKANGHVIEEKITFSQKEVAQGVVLSLAKRMVLLLHFSRFDKPPRVKHGLVGYSDSMNFLRLELDKVADLATPVLLRGPSGSGKELVARAIHNAGGKHRPFVAVNMGAIPHNLAASELFGALKGSFTGADRTQLGFFRNAEGGTLFLDEIGEASPEVQVMLLRALESGEVTPVGAQRPFPIRTRLIAATDADLEAKMKEDSFKAPLFHRLAGYEISLPPLTQRLEDFGRLFMHFAGLEMAEMGGLPSSRQVISRPWIPADLMERLLFFSWPGNVRQLANVVRQLVIGCRGEPVLRLTPKVTELLANGIDLNTGDPAEKPKGIRKPSDIMPDELKQALRDQRWELKATAADLGISRGTLYQLIERTPGLHKARDLSADQIQAALAETGGDEEAAAAKLEVSLRALRRRITDLKG